MLIAKGDALKLGCEKAGSIYNFAFASESSRVSLLLYSEQKKPILRVDMDEAYKKGNVFACKISGIFLDKALYCYEEDGKKVIDPYAKTITDCERFGKINKNPLYLSRVVTDDFDWDGDTTLNIPYEECIIYKLHVRGYTKSRTSMVNNKGTFEGIIEKIPYIKSLGITSIELMPAYEFDENMRFDQLYEKDKELKEKLGKYVGEPIKRPVNYWGYVDGFMFAPKSSYTSISADTSDYTVEFKKMVKMLHEQNIELIMEMHFTDKAPGYILDCVRYWVENYHIDGVHYYGSQAGLEALAADPFLSDTKIITVNWEGKRGTFRHMGSCNEDYSNIARKFLKGDENQLESFANVSRKNLPNSASINFITNHNGFTMMDLVSYDRKHNEANGENNRDGENFNNSWNCGVEGKTKKQKICRLRKKQIKNAFIMLLCSQGTPLILAGDEFENTQHGNNNPYCIDGETTYLKWKNKELPCETLEFVKKLIALRKEHAVFHMPKQFISANNTSGGFPDISYHGSSAWYQTMENYDRHIGIMYCENNELVYVAYNMHWESHMLGLPKVPAGSHWKIELTSSDDEKISLDDNKAIFMEPRTSAILTCTIDKNTESKEKV